MIGASSSWLVGGTGQREPEVWPRPCLVSLGLLHDGQPLATNWDALSHVLVAAPTGQGAEAVLTAAVASLAGQRPPADLGLVTIAEPRALPEELGALPHQLTRVVDPHDAAATTAAIEQVRAELDRRVVAGATEEPDLVLAVAELAGLDAEHMALLGPVLLDGPRHRVRLLAASCRPAAELAERCPFLAEFGTRLVLRTADEDESVALLGAAGAEELGTGGHLLLRLEGRVPIEAYGFRVAADRLAQLVRLMHDRPEASPAPVDRPPPAEVELARPRTEDAVGEQELATPAEASAESDAAEADIDDARTEPVQDAATQPVLAAESASAAPSMVLTQPSAPVSVWSTSKRLQQLHAAPLRVRCFGGREVWYGDEPVWPNPAAVEDTGWELLLILAVHPIAGVQTETLIDILWPDRAPKNPSATLRKRRFRLRQELRLLVPDLEGEPLPTDPDGQVHRLEPAVVACDVHLFLELVECARSLPPAVAIAAYEEALALYRGDLLDSLDVPNYWWLYHGPALATSLRSDYRRQQRDVRLRLAELRAAGPDEGLARAEELYAGLTGEDPEDEQLWAALFRVHGRRGDPIGLEASVRRLRSALVEVGRAASPDTAVLSEDLQAVLKEVRKDLRRRTSPAVA